MKKIAIFVLKKYNKDIVLKIFKIFDLTFFLNIKRLRKATSRVQTSFKPWLTSVYLIICFDCTMTFCWLLCHSVELSQESLVYGGYFINPLMSRQNGQHFTDDILKCIFVNGNIQISNTIWLKFVPKGQIDNNTALVQLMAWRGTADKLLSEPMLA